MGTHPAPSASRAALQQLIDDYGDDSAPVLRVEVAMALYNRGVTLGQLDRAQEELAAYQQLIDDYGDDPSPALREQVELATAALDQLGGT